MKTPSYMITGDQLLRQKQITVYLWFRASGECLYIGHSTEGYGRVLGNHHAVGKLEEIKSDDTIYFYSFDNKEAACLFETQSIMKHRPKYNKMHNNLDKPKQIKPPTLYGPARFKQT